MVRARDRLEATICLGSVSPAHEDDRLSGPDRQALRRAGDNAQLEHDSRGGEDFEATGVTQALARYRFPQTIASAKAAPHKKILAGSGEVTTAKAASPKPVWPAPLLLVICMRTKEAAVGEKLNT